MIFTPSHKVVGDVGKPGQIVNRPSPTASFDRYPYLKHSTADQSLGDYLARKKRYEALDTLQPLAESAPKNCRYEELSRVTKLSTQPDARPVAWMHSVENDDGDQDYVLSFAPDNFPLKGVAGLKSLHVQPLYAAAPDLSAEIERLRDELDLCCALKREYQDQAAQAAQPAPQPLTDVPTTYKGQG